MGCTHCNFPDRRRRRRRDSKRDISVFLLRKAERKPMMGGEKNQHHPPTHPHTLPSPAKKKEKEAKRDLVAVDIWGRKAPQFLLPFYPYTQREKIQRAISHHVLREEEKIIVSLPSPLLLGQKEKKVANHGRK